MTELPLGLWLKNPFNLESTHAFTWQGEVKPSSHQPYCQFDTVENGLRAGFKNLLTAYYKHNRRTPREIIEPYAPPHENDTEAYVADFCSGLGCDENTVLDFKDDKILLAAGRTIINHENGAQPFTDNQLLEALFLARGLSGHA